MENITLLEFQTSAVFKVSAILATSVSHRCFVTALAGSPLCRGEKGVTLGHQAASSTSIAPVENWWGECKSHSRRLAIQATITFDTGTVDAQLMDLTSMIDVVWNLRQQREISSAQSAVTQTKQDLGRANHHIRDLEESLVQVTQASQALWELMRERLGVTDAELLAKVNEIKHRGASQAQGAPVATASCAKCARPVGANAARCPYCGTPVAKNEVFG